MAIVEDFTGWVAVKFLPGDEKYSWLPALPGSRLSVPPPTSRILSAANTSMEARQKAVVLSTPSVTVRTQAHTSWFTPANLQAMLGAATGSTPSTYEANRSGGYIPAGGPIQVFNGFRARSWPKWKLSTLEITSYGIGPLDVVMTLAPFGGVMVSTTPPTQVAALAELGATPPDELDIIPYSGEGVSVTGPTDVQQLSLMFMNALEPVVLHSGTPAVVASYKAPTDYKNGIVMHALTLDQINNAATYNPTLLLFPTPQIQIGFKDALNSPGLGVQFTLRYDEAAIEMPFSVGSGLSVTRRTYQNGSPSSNVSLQVGAMA